MQAFQREIHIDGEIYIALFSSLHILVYFIRLYLEHIFGWIKEENIPICHILWSIRLILEKCTPLSFFGFSSLEYCSPRLYGTPLCQNICIMDPHNQCKWLPVQPGGTMFKKTFPFSIDFYGKKSSFDPNISNIMHNRSKITSDSGGTH